MAEKAEWFFHGIGRAARPSKKAENPSIETDCSSIFAEEEFMISLPEFCVDDVVH